MSSGIGALVADLHVLHALAQAGSYTRAAQRLGVAKATVSLRVVELERSIGVPLVRRTTRSVALTSAGQQLLADTGPALARIAQSIEEVRDLAGEPRGLVRVTAPVALGRQHLVGPLTKVLQRYPDMRVELVLEDREVNLIQEGFDLAIRHTQAPDESYVAWLLCESRSVLVASASYLHRRGVPRHPDDLSHHACLLYPRGGAMQRWTFEKAAGTRLETVSTDVGGPFTVNNSEALRDAVLAGLGIGMLPDFSAVAGGGNRHLRRILPDWSPRGAFGQGIYALRPWAPRVPRAVQCLVQAWKEALQPGFSSAAAPHADQG